MSKRWTLVLTALTLCVGIAGVAPASSAPPSGLSATPRPTSYILPGDSVFPEGIAFQQSTGNFFVSSTGDGTIFRGNVQEAEAEVFLPGSADGRTFAVGMKVDDAGRLFVSGGGTGKMFVYDTVSRALLANFDSNVAPTFINDVAIAPDGAAYFTDSLSPLLYRVAPDGGGRFTFETWLDFTGTALVYQTGFNVNGIVATPDGKYLIVVQSNTGKLFRITIPTKQVVEIDQGGATVGSGDGLLLRGHALYVVRNALNQIVKLQLAGDFSSGYAVSTTTDPSFIFPTTIAEARGRLLVVNSQFNNRGGTPVLPFTVSSIPIP